MNRNLKERDLEDLLTHRDQPEPPAELLARIKAEIPEQLTLAPPPAAVPEPRRPAFGWFTWRSYALAASLLATVGTGFFFLRRFDEVPPLEPRADRQEAAEDEAPIPPQPPPPPAARMASPAAPKPQVSQDALRSLGYVAPAEVEADEVSKLARERKREVRDEETITVTSESPLLDERRVSAAVPSSPKRDKARSNVQEVEGGVEGGVAGGVPGGSPGGIVGGIPAPEAQPSLAVAPAPSTGGTAEPNDQPYGDVFFREAGTNPFVDADEDRLSTFGLDVDTGSFTVARRYLVDGNLPPREAIRVEEFINAFAYGDPAPRQGDFALTAEAAPTPFAPESYRVVRFAVKAREIDARDRKPALLIFTIDVSGSMSQENRLGLVKKALRMLLDELSPEDRVAVVVYGSNGRVLLEPSADLTAVGRAIDALVPEGATNAEEGLRLAYELAERNFRPGAINRIILCSDGVANVGATGPESILARIRTAANKGIELTTVGFGMGNYNDALMEQLANQGDGRYSYVDDLSEARRIFVEELTGTLQTVAGDAKAQVEWNPAVVSRWRLLGYENRDIADQKFRDDTVDAGEIGVGHTVTALYEVKLKPEAPARERLAALRLRYRSKESGEVIEQEKVITLAEAASSFEEAPAALRLATTVAEFAEVLKGSFWAKDGSFEALLSEMQAVSADLPGRTDVAELVGLVGRTARLTGATP